MNITMGIPTIVTTTMDITRGMIMANTTATTSIITTATTPVRKMCAAVRPADRIRRGLLRLASPGVHANGHGSEPIGGRALSAE